MIRRIFCAALWLLLASLLFVSCGKKEQPKNASSDSITPTVIEEVTNANGETVTNAAGEAVTEVYEQIPVVDENGKVVKDENGEVVTQKVPATEAQKDKNAGVDSGSTTKKQSGSPAATKPGSGLATTKPSGGSAPTTTKPGSASTTTKPSGGSAPTTTKPTEKPTESTTVRSENIDYFVSYAIQYGTKTLGLTYRSDITNANGGSNDTPIPITSPVVGNYKISYKENEIRGYLQAIKSEGFTNFWVSKQKVSGNSYELFIGYYIGI